MQRRIDSYLASLVGEDKFDFYGVVRDFADSEIAPHLLNWERSHQLVPDDAIAKMGDLGLFGLPIDERYGGQGGDMTDLVLMGLAIGYHSHSVAITPGAAISLGAKPLQLCGSEAQKSAHLPDLAAGRRMFVFGLSEPGRGSDAANPQVTAVRKGDRWVLNGEKCWSTNARWASHVVVHALTDPKGPHGRRSTCFIVPMDAPGVFYQEMSGKRVWTMSSTGSIMFEDVEVPGDAILGEENNGFKVMVATLNGGRLFVASLAIASAAFALDKLRFYAEERIQFDEKPIGRFQRVQDVVIDLDIMVERNLTWLMHCCNLYEEGRLDRERAAKVKVDSSRTASELVMLAMEAAGGVACLDEFGLIRHHDDLFVTRVGEGSNFALKDLIVRPLRS
ncbi:MAG: acyl-CoA dehydrogenase family protein [Planctomycetota bacterium]